MRATPEHELVERCRQGDETAFRELVDQYKGLVFALIARSIPNRARAEELAQDVFLKVHKGLPYFRGEAEALDVDLPHRDQRAVAGASGAGDGVAGRGAGRRGSAERRNPGPTIARSGTWC